MLNKDLEWFITRENDSDNVHLFLKDIESIEIQYNKNIYDFDIDELRNVIESKNFINEEDKHKYIVLLREVIQIAINEMFTTNLMNLADLLD